MDFLLRSEIEMDFIESSLCRLQKYVPSAALWDVPSLKAQIELRQRDLTDIEIIRLSRSFGASCGRLCVAKAGSNTARAANRGGVDHASATPVIDIAERRASRPRGAIAPEFGELALGSSLKLRLGSPT